MGLNTNSASTPKRVTGGQLVTTASFLLIVGGGLMLTQHLGMRTYKTATAPLREVPTVRSEMQLGNPISLSLPSIETQLTIKQGLYDPDTRQWTLDNSHAFYMQGSVTPIIYGHNKAGVFNRLNELRLKDDLIVTNDEGAILTFKYTDTKTVTPEDAWLLQERHANKLMLLSCTGLFYESRQVLYFDYVGISS